jgi:hypothetical protein
MISLRSVLSAICLLSLISGFQTGSAVADSSHARIVRLSLVQGDVRFARDLKGDPLADGQGDWEEAVLNLPIRQGYVVATDNGRTEVEFENGAMAFLAENTVLEFYDLSSEDGGFTTRLILRQGSAEFYVNPGSGDYFSVTGGDFSVQADTRTTFRMNNFDDGSNVHVLHGRLTALANGKNTPVAKGQSFSLKAGDPASMQVDRAPDSDEFDQWVSGRIESVNTATTAAMQYSNNSDYTSGYADLYTYGGWFPVAGYGSCWRPYGVGLGWSPFDSGSWFYDSAFGWSFIGGQPWGWLPYHYGGWIFRPGLGWVWSPSSNFGGVGGLGRWRPVTGTWMRSAGGVAIVPSHPLDGKGKTPLNLSSGLFAVTTRGVSGRVPAENSDRWKVENKPARDVMQNQLATTSAPSRVSRAMTVAGTNANSGSATTDRQSTIIYDRTERKFVNSDSPRSTVRNATEGATTANGANNATSQQQGQTQGRTQVRIYPEPNKGGNQPAVPPTSNRATGREGSNAPVPAARNTVPMPARPPVTPPSVPRAVTSERVFSETGARSGGSARGGVGNSGGATASAPAAAPRASSPAPSAPAAGSTGGGRPH